MTPETRNTLIAARDEWLRLATFALSRATAGSAYWAAEYEAAMDAYEAVQRALEASSSHCLPVRP